MLTTDQNKRIAGELGLCWHEWTANPGFLWNPDTTVTMCLKCGKLGEEPNYNYPFDTREGFWLIIENGPMQGWWHKFLKESKVAVIYITKIEQARHGKELWAIKQDYIGPQLAVELSRWLEER